MNLKFAIIQTTACIGENNVKKGKVNSGKKYRHYAGSIDTHSSANEYAEHEPRDQSSQHHYQALHSQRISDTIALVTLSII